VRCEFQRDEIGGAYQHGGVADVPVKTPLAIVLLYQFSFWINASICPKFNQNDRTERVTVLHNQPCMNFVFVYYILGRTNNWYIAVINTLQIKKIK